MTGSLQENQYTFFIVSRSVFVRMRNVVGLERKNSHFMFNNFFVAENRATDDNMAHARCMLDA